MNSTSNQMISQLATQFFIRNYDYLWLKTMLDQAASTEAFGSTLITGSSHALNGIKESCWDNAFNCSMHSQDIYYDFQCARWVLERVGAGRFARCFIVMGYYIAYQDLSLSKVSRDTVIANIYYPIFGDAHNWESPSHRDLWDGFGDIPEPIKAICERVSAQKLLEYGTYYSEIRPRGTLFDLKGRTWAQVTRAERLAMGQARAAAHNRTFQHKESFEENKRVFKEFVHFLYAHDVRPIVVITPFSTEYNRYILPEMKAGMLGLLDSVPEDIHYVDFNQTEGLFGSTDFMDTDHLNASGAEKVSSILSEMFGK